MADFIEIKDSDRNSIFVKLSPGKQYLTASAPVDQKAQKGPTCWFYAYNSSRLRLGKEFDEELKALNQLLQAQLDAGTLNTKEAQGYHDFLSELKVKRESEIAISEYRKVATRCDELERVSKKHLGKDDTLQLIRKRPRVDPATFPTGSLAKDYGDLLSEFQGQDATTSFKAFLFSKTNERLKLAAKKTLRDLGAVSVIETMENHEAKTSPQQVAILYHTYIRIAAGGLLGLKKSTWEPKNGIDGLMIRLKSEGALVVACKEGSMYYKSAPQEIKSDPGLPYLIYDWLPEQHKSADEIKRQNGHAVTIVGVEKAAAESKSAGSIYFVDPNDPSVPGQPLKVYKAPYEQFVVNVQPGPLFYGEAGSVQASINRYNAIKTRLGFKPKPKITPPPQVESKPKGLASTIMSDLKLTLDAINFLNNPSKGFLLGMVAAAVLVQIPVIGVLGVVAVPFGIVGGIGLSIVDKYKSKQVASDRMEVSKLPVPVTGEGAGGTKQIIKSARFEGSPVYRNDPVMSAPAAAPTIVKVVGDSVELENPAKPKRTPSK